MCLHQTAALGFENGFYAADHAEELREQGFTELPVVVDDNGETFSGFRYDRLTA